ncbi:MAG: hypothetical protein IPL61_18420 [Myxococcales bacterium]|nr:hypothetical protein [Myxococcales bacterium]
MPSIRILALALVVAVAACSDKGGNTNGDIDAPIGTGDGGADGDGGTNGDGGTTGDGGGPAGCIVGGPECNNCIDDDGDGRIDGQDIECTGALDDDERSFATGIPGDNIDTVHQDCFFDGNSGSGNDGCDIHVCCLLGAPDRASCPFGANQYDPAECTTPQTQACIGLCAPLAPPGCDCFGCCTICDPTTDVCRDILTNPAVAPNCDAQHLDDPVACPSCVQRTDCGTPCDPEMCILCPGQDPSDLPTSCMGSNMCPAGQATCSPTMACASGQFCSNGCCIDGVP